MENKELRIKVIGIGGAGNNIVNCMNENKLDGVELYAANTDRQVLDASARVIDDHRRRKPRPAIARQTARVAVRSGQRDADAEADADPLPHAGARAEIGHDPFAA